MDAKEITGLGLELMDFLAGFDDCFGRSEPREHLRTYVSGQLSDLPRKSVEPIALSADVPPRTLQKTRRRCWRTKHRPRRSLGGAGWAGRVVERR